jgi:hypothetical protein
MTEKHNSQRSNDTSDLWREKPMGAGVVFDLLRHR